MTGFSIQDEFFCESQRVKGYFFLVRRDGDCLELSITDSTDSNRKVTKCYFDHGEIRPESKLGSRCRLYEYADLTLLESIPDSLSSDVNEVAREAADQFLAFEQESGRANIR
jgi:hypothetical protein